MAYAYRVMHAMSMSIFLLTRARNIWPSTHSHTQSFVKSYQFFPSMCLLNLSNSLSESVRVKGTQSCPTLYNLIDCSLPDSSVHGILQARTLEWLANHFSRGSFWSRDWTRVSHIVGRFFTGCATREAPPILYMSTNALDLTTTVTRLQPPNWLLWLETCPSPTHRLSIYSPLSQNVLPLMQI